MRLENWREAEAFVRAQGRKSVGDLAALALDGYLRETPEGGEKNKEGRGER
jgi:hypothetical protein